MSKKIKVRDIKEKKKNIQRKGKNRHIELELAKRGHKKEKTKRFTWVWLTNDQI